MNKRKKELAEQLKEGVDARKAIQQKLNELEKQDKSTRYAFSRESFQEYLNGMAAIHKAPFHLGGQLISYYRLSEPLCVKCLSTTRDI